MSSNEYRIHINELYIPHNVLYDVFIYIYINSFQYVQKQNSEFSSERKMAFNFNCLKVSFQT